MKKPITLIAAVSIFTVALVILFSCEKDKAPKPPTGNNNKITFTVIDTDSISYRSASFSCSINTIGGQNIQQHGFCWDTQENPDITKNKTELGTMTNPGEFSSDLSSLQPETKYFIKAYVTFNDITLYGGQATFTTNPIGTPTVITNEVTNITAVSAQCSGNVTANNGSEVTARGVCWNTSQNPTISNSHTTDGTGMGGFTSDITGLTTGVKYYVRAYATNSTGTAFGNQLSFTAFWLCGSQITYMDQNYNTVLIGNQCWMAENLNVGTRINGSQNMSDNGTIEKYCYDDNEAYCDEYGGLYQWDEIMQYVTDTVTQGICPNGWHLPTDNEWTTLTDFLGGDDVAGGKMKEAGTVHWSSPNTGATNSSGFTGLPGGCRYYSNGSFEALGLGGYWWSSSESSGTNSRRTALASVASRTDWTPFGGH
jgi:uncharacterized protein (TIGR02145 family)